MWQIDLVDMQKHSKINAGHKYILTVIDVLSRYAWAAPVRDKSAASVTAAMQTILSGPRQPKFIQADQGREFWNAKFRALMTSRGIHLYHTFTHVKSAHVERFNRTLRNWMWIEFGVQGTYKWLALLPRLLTRYNHRLHRSIQMRPVEPSPRA